MHVREKKAKESVSLSPQGFTPTERRGWAVSSPAPQAQACTPLCGIANGTALKARLWKGKKIKIKCGNIERKWSFRRVIRYRRLALGHQDVITLCRVSLIAGQIAGAAYLCPYTRPAQREPHRSLAFCFSLENLSHILDYFCIVLAWSSQVWMHSALEEWQMLFSVLPRNFRQSRIKCSTAYSILIYWFWSAVPQKFIRGELKVWNGRVLCSLPKRPVLSTATHLCHVLVCYLVLFIPRRTLKTRYLKHLTTDCSSVCVCTNRIVFCPGWANKINHTLHSCPWKGQASWQPLTTWSQWLWKRDGGKFIKNLNSQHWTV